MRESVLAAECDHRPAGRDTSNNLIHRPFILGSSLQQQCWAVAAVCLSCYSCQHNIYVGIQCGRSNSAGSVKHFPLSPRLYTATNLTAIEADKDTVGVDEKDCEIYARSRAAVRTRQPEFPDFSSAVFGDHCRLELFSHSPCFAPIAMLCFRQRTETSHHRCDCELC